MVDKIWAIVEEVMDGYEYSIRSSLSPRYEFITTKDADGNFAGSSFPVEHHIPVHKKRKIKDYRHENWVEEIKCLIHFIIELYDRIDGLAADFDHKDIEAYLRLCRKQPNTSSPL